MEKEKFNFFSIKDGNEVFSTSNVEDFFKSIEAIKFATASLKFGDGMLNILIWR